MTPSRRTGWLVLAAAVAGVLVGRGLAGRRTRRASPTSAVRTAIAPTTLTSAGPPPASDTSRSLARMAAGAGLVVVLCILTVIVTKPSDRHSARPSAEQGLQHGDLGRLTSPQPPPAGPSSGPMPTPLSLADCQAVIAAQPNLTTSMICGYETAGLDGRYDEPSADPNDPRYAGAALPVGMSTDGRICVAGSERPVLDTVRPTLSASFTAAPGLQRIESTFQITGVYGRTAEDLQLAGDYGDPLKATLEMFRHGSLKHGESYRWRVRGTPPTVGAAGWSPWCEFTIPEKTPDDLGVDDDRNYRATLTAAEWQQVLAVFAHPEDDAAARASIRTATKAAPTPAARVPVTLTGRDWFGIVNYLAWTASENNDQATWKLADLVSSALGGPDPVTLGHSRS